MRVLITGAAGQLGRALSEALGPERSLPFAREALDITRPEEVRAALERHRPDRVVNAAAFTDVDGAEADPEAARRVNAAGAEILARETGARGTPLLQLSTDYVFDGRSERPYHEEDRPRPLSVYGETKLEGERRVREHNPRHWIVRTAWLYHDAGRNFPNAIRGAARRPDELRVVADQLGSPTYAPHLARAIVELLSSDAYGTIHVAGQGAASRYDLAREVLAALGVERTIRPVSSAEFPRPARRPAYAVLTSLRSVPRALPAWRAGVAAYARAIRSAGTP